MFVKLYFHRPSTLNIASYGSSLSKTYINIKIYFN
jgi:hypothetical protein